MKTIIKPTSFGTLVKYYRKRQKLTQSRLGNHIGKDNSMVSRIEKGEIIPNKPTADIIASICKLSNKDLDEFFHAHAQAILSRDGVSTQQVFLKDEEAIQLATTSVDLVRKMRIQGMPKLAVADAEQKVELLHNLCIRTNRETTKKQLQIHLSQLLMEVSKSYMDFLLPSQVWGYMNPLIEKQEKIAKELKDPTSKMLGEISKESALYVCKDYEGAHKIGARIHSNINLLDNNWHSEVIRASAINAGYLKSKNEVSHLKDDINYYVQENGGSDPMNSSFLLEGLARAQGAVKDKNVFKTIEKAWHYIDLGKKNGKHSALRRVQLIRTQLKIMREINDDNRHSFERIGQKGLILAEAMGYERYEKEIKKMLDTTLNNI